MKMKIFLVLLAGAFYSGAQGAEDVTDLPIGEGAGSIAVKLDNVNFDKLVHDVDAKLTAQVGDITTKLNVELLNFDIKNCGTGVVSTCTNVSGGCNVNAVTNCSKTQGLNVAPTTRLYLGDLFHAINPAMMDLKTLPVDAEKRFVLYFRPENSYSQIVEWDRKGVVYRAAFVLFTKETLDAANYHLLPPIVRRELQGLFKKYNTILKIYLSRPASENDTRILYSEVGELASKEDRQNFIAELDSNIKALWIDEENALNITYLKVSDPRKVNADHPELTVHYMYEN